MAGKQLTGPEINTWLKINQSWLANDQSDFLSWESELKDLESKTNAKRSY